MQKSKLKQKRSGFSSLFSNLLSLISTKNLVPRPSSLVSNKGYTFYSRREQAGYTLYPQRGQAGYTLIELVIVILVMIAVGGIVVGILYSAIRGTTKARVNNNISQNGSYAITFMSSFIANAKDLVSVTDPFGQEFTDCVSDTPIDGVSVTILNPDDNTTTFSCNGTTISSNSATLLQSEDVEVVSDSCRMLCIQDSFYSAPRIDISFELQSKNAASPETSGRSLFETSVTLRNYGL